MTGEAVIVGGISSQAGLASIRKRLHLNTDQQNGSRDA